MKNFLFLILILISSTICCQNIAPIAFLGNDFKYYKGATLLIDPANKGMFRMYSKLKYLSVFKISKVLEPRADYNYTDAQKIKNSEYLVLDIYENPKEMVNNYGFDNDPIFVLQDIHSKETYYFPYSKVLNFEFPFMVKNLTLPDDYFCNKIHTYYDEFEDNTSYSFGFGYKEDVSVSANKENGETYYYLRLEGSSLSYKIREGLFIIFGDGTKLSLPNQKLSVKVGNIHRGTTWYDLSTLVTLDKKTIDKIIKLGISKYKIGESTKQLTNEQNFLLKEFTSCLYRSTL